MMSNLFCFMTAPQSIQYLEFLLDMISDNKRNAFPEVLKERTRHVTVVLEDIFQSHNAAALLRTCECFGVQDVHVIENENNFDAPNRIVKGAHQWLNIHYYDRHTESTKQCINGLKEKGYKIVGLTPHEQQVELHDFQIEQPFALIFGTEKKGLSTQAMELCDVKLNVPMFGFTESLNVSVCAGIVIQHLVSKIKNSDVNWSLDTDEKLQLHIQWAEQVVGNPELMRVEFLKKNNSHRMA